MGAAARITGGDASDWMGIEVKDNGVNIQPYTAVGDAMRSPGEPSWSLSGWVDDYTVSFLRSS